VTADWLQGPYVYALYTYYGYPKRDIGILYIAGFASSAIFGTFIASLADTYGRKLLILVFCVTYTLSCLVKHFKQFEMLLLGRILGGIAYSILFSVFESWLAHEHLSTQLSTKSLSEIFGKAQFWNSVLAICAGQISGTTAAYFGKVAPFDLSAVVLIVTAIYVYKYWSENYGDRTTSAHLSLCNAAKTMKQQPRLILIGLVQSCFESALYTFTFLWTPLLQERFESLIIPLTNESLGIENAASLNNLDQEIPHGLVFSSYMACMMIGSKIYSKSVSLNSNFSTSLVLLITLISGMLSFCIAALSHSLHVVHYAFLVFEISCGIYFPAISTLRSTKVPSEQRAAMLSLYRVPLNVLVVVILIIDWSNNTVCIICAVLMGIGVVCQGILWMLELKESKTTIVDSRQNGNLENENVKEETDDERDDTVESNHGHAIGVKIESEIQ